MYSEFTGVAPKNLIRQDASRTAELGKRCDQYGFIRPDRRRRWIERYLLVQTLRYVKDRGISSASSDVPTGNAYTSVLRRSIGHVRPCEELFLGTQLHTPSAVDSSRVI